MRVALHPMLLRAGFALALMIALPACDSPTIPPVESEEEEEEEDPGDSIAPRAGWRPLVEIPTPTARTVAGTQ